MAECKRKARIALRIKNTTAKTRNINGYAE